MKNRIKILLVCLIISHQGVGQMETMQSKLSFLEEHIVFSVPFIDSLKFDTNKADNVLSIEQIKLLKLDKVFSLEDYDNPKIGINYILNLSKQFKTIAFYFYSSDVELSSTLVTYDSYFNVIDHMTVAMDEIAEGILWTESKIDTDLITITHHMLMDEKTDVTKEYVEVGIDGKFTTKH